MICGLQGYCIGGGLQIAIACDVRIAAEDAVLGLPAVKEAFIPGMSTFRLPRLIGMGHARHLILSGQNILAQEALPHRAGQQGGPDRGPGRRAGGLGKRLREVPRPSIAWSKRLSNLAYDVAFERFLEEFDRAAEAVISSEEHRAAREGLAGAEDAVVSRDPNVLGRGGRDHAARVS